MAPRAPDGRRFRAGAFQPARPRCRGCYCSERSQVKDYPYWLDTIAAADTALDPPHSSSGTRISLPRRVDVAIVGGGYTGLSAARHLARSGAEVVVLERDRIGAGASSRNGGQVIAGMKLDASTLVDRFGERRARELFDISRDAIAALEHVIVDERIACDYEKTGHLMAAWKPRHFAAFEKEQTLLARMFDHRVEVVPQSRQRE